MSLENWIARIEANRPDASNTPVRDPSKRETGFGTVLRWALFLGLVWGALAFPFGAVLAFAILGPIGAGILLPWLWFTRNRRASPERQAVFDLLGYLNPFS